MTTVDRHLTLDTLAYYLRSGQHVVRPIAGSPAAKLDISPASERLAIEIAWDGEDPPRVDDYEHIVTGVVHKGGANWAVLAIQGAALFSEGYPLLCYVADAIQEEGLPFSAAVPRAISRYHELLAREQYLPVEREIGLVGELFVLRCLMMRLGGGTALSSWRGGDQEEEHDFGLEHDDVEVKTTRSESRTHMIGSLTQLKPNPERALWLTSIQVTGGGRAGTTLPHLVASIHQSLSPDLRDNFGSRLADAGYRSNQPEHTYLRWMLRSVPRVYAVQGSFPRLDRDLLEKAEVPLDHIGQVSYRIDVSNEQPSSTRPDELDFLDTESL
jgi:hypothetical protein